MARNPEADLVAQLVGDPAEADLVIGVVGDQVIEATPADVGKVVTVAGDGSLVLAAGSAGGIQSVTATAPAEVDNTDPDNPIVGVGADLTDLVARWVAASASGPASLDFGEDTDNGTSRVRLIAPASIAADTTLTLPAATGTVALAEAAPKAVVAIGDGGGNHTTTSSTFADIHASLYDMSIAAVAGDLLIIRFECQWFHSNAGDQCRIRFTVAGAAASGTPTNGLFPSAPAAGNSNFNTFTWRHVVQAGDISGGNVAVVPQFATTASTLNIRNDGTNGKPLMTVENWRQ